MTESNWKQIKESMDSQDDGDGPYLLWTGQPDEFREIKEVYYQQFLVWAKDHMGQGYSLACNDGYFLDTTTHYAFKGFCAGMFYRDVGLDKVFKDIAEKTVLQVRGSYDAPGFGYCVEQEAKEVAKLFLKNI